LAVIFGQDYYTDELMNHTFKISHQSYKCIGAHNRPGTQEKDAE